jgi:hypothetical protein
MQHLFDRTDPDQLAGFEMHGAVGDSSRLFHIVGDDYARHLPLVDNA